MTDKEDKKKSTLTLKPKQLQLTKTVEKGAIQQSFSRGQSKTVAVEVKKKRQFHLNQQGDMEAVSGASSEQAGSESTISAEGQKIENDVNSTGDSGLTESEQSKRMRVLKEAQEEAERLKQEQAEAEKIAKERKAAPTPEEIAEELVAQSEAAETAGAVDTDVIESTKETEEVVTSESSSSSEADSDSESGKKDSKRRGKSRGKYDEDDEDDDFGKKKSKASLRTLKLRSQIDEADNGRSFAAVKRAREKARRQQEDKKAFKETEKFIREVVVPETITVQELANRMAERSTDLIKELMKLGMMVTVNQMIDADTAELLVETFGHKIKRVSESDVEDILEEQEGDSDAVNLKPRAPIVTVMGHVDHGKTSLLDALRATDVVAGESGGITQHIGAYRITLANGEHITFLDTPGHEAFTSMRLRGAHITDIVVLVVAADDGIMEQTVEAINHAKAADVPIIVAVNKIDKPDADPQRVYNELLSHELVPESLGGDIMVIEVSAKEKINLDKLEEAILLQAEILELQANPKRKAAGMVVESSIEPGRGVVTTLLVQKGTLKIGNIIVAGHAYGKVRALINDKGKHLKAALPSYPVEVLGLDISPDAGEPFHVVESEKQARDITEYRQRKSRDLRMAQVRKTTLEEMFLEVSEGAKELPIIVKGDVQGSVEAIQASLDKLATDEIRVKILHAAVGGITSSDVALANASRAIILGFNVRANAQVKELVASENIDVRYYSIIYDLVNDLKAILGGMLEPVIRENYIGTAEIRKVFSVSKIGKIAGCFVVDGMIKRGAKVRLLRDDIVIHEGKLKTLKRFKEDVKEVGNSYECGMAFENYDDIKEGDIIEAAELIEEEREL